jgi:hypothetical protein
MQVWRILHHNGLYPYHLQRVQHLLPNDYEQRLQFCNWLQTNWHSLDNNLFTDEALFTRDGINNTRNSHIWANENPHAVVECNFQHRFSVNVWCGVLHKCLIGPHFIEGHLTSVQYRSCLQHELPRYWKMYLWHRESGCGYNTMEHRLTTAGRLLHT